MNSFSPSLSAKPNVWSAAFQRGFKECDVCNRLIFNLYLQPRSVVSAFCHIFLSVNVCFFEKFHRMADLYHKLHLYLSPTMHSFIQQRYDEFLSTLTNALMKYCTLFALMLQTLSLCFCHVSKLELFLCPAVPPLCSTRPLHILTVSLLSRWPMFQHPNPMADPTARRRGQEGK